MFSYLAARAAISAGVRAMSYNLTSSIAPLNALPPPALSQPICRKLPGPDRKDHVAEVAVWTPLT